MCARDKSGQRYALYRPIIRSAHAPKTKTHRKTRETDMSINYLEQTGIITIETSHTMYQMSVDENGFLRHLYYGKRFPLDDMSYLYPGYDRACAGSPDEALSQQDDFL